MSIMSPENRKKRIADLFTEEHDRMRGYLRKLVSDSAEWESEDIIQDVMLNIFDAADITRPISNLSAYVYRSLRNRAIDYLRRVNRNVSLDDPGRGSESRALADILYDSRYDTASEYDKKEIRDRLYNAIDGLADEDRALIIMTEFENRSFREISEGTGVPMGTLLSRKSRAMKKLRKTLGEYTD